MAGDDVQICCSMHLKNVIGEGELEFLLTIPKDEPIDYLKTRAVSQYKEKYPEYKNAVCKDDTPYILLNNGDRYPRDESIVLRNPGIATVGALHAFVSDKKPKSMSVRVHFDLRL